MLKILAIIGYILLAVIIFICWVIIVPRSIYIEYDKKDSLTVKIRVFLFKLSLYPRLFFQKAEEQEGQQEQQVGQQGQGQQEQQEQQGKQGQHTPQPSENVPKPSPPIEIEQLPSDGQQTDSEQNRRGGERPSMEAHVPQAEKNPKSEKKSKADKPKKEKSDKDYFANLPQGFELVKEGLQAAKGVFRILLRWIKIKDVSFTLPLQGKDAYETQQIYGTVTSSFYAFNSFVQRYVKIYYKKPMFVADFANLYSDSTYFYCKIQASPSIMLMIGWYLFKTYRKIIKSNSTKEI